MGDLTTILGIQLGQKLDEIQKALGDGASYLAAQGRKGGQSSSNGRTQAVSVPAHGEGEAVLPDAGFVSRDGNGKFGEGSMRPPVSYLPPAGGDRVVTPEQPLINKRGYLTQQVPVMNEKGQIVNVMGPKGAPVAYLQKRPEDAVTTIPNDAGLPAYSAGRTPDPEPQDRPNGALVRPFLPPEQQDFMIPKDQKTKGVFLKHMKSMYEQMLQQMGTLT